jgi:hypothetical protein
MLKLDRTGQEIRLVVPASFYDPADIERHLQRITAPCDHSISQVANDVSLTLQAREGDVEAITQDLFAQINGYPFFGGVDIAGFKNAARPLLSCIILLTANDLFVKNGLLPSLIKHSAGYDLEILLVHNGLETNLSQFRNFELIPSEFGCVAKGYNAGARRARGHYLAIFHDDCLVNDPNWIDKSLQQLERGYLAATPQIDQMFQSRLANAKNVPLVMRTQDFFELGGYDEHYYIGYEDMDFTHQILRAGRQVAKVELAHLHFEGMSTIIMYSGKPHLFRLLFGLNIFPQRCLKPFRDYYLLRLLKHREIQFLRQEHLLYFSEKFRDYLDQTQQWEMLEAEVQQLRLNFDSSFLRDRDQVIQFYRDLVG